jgi:hypothetical protein
MSGLRYGVIWVTLGNGESEQKESYRDEGKGVEKIEVLFSLSWLVEPRVEIEEASRKGKK